MSGTGRILFLGSGNFQRERKDKGRSSRRGRNGGGGVRHGWERQREITLHLIYLIVPKGIDKDSELSSVQGTQGMTTAWIFAATEASFLGFRTIFLGPINCV
jgi:hypothetical protein